MEAVAVAAGAAVAPVVVDADARTVAVADRAQASGWTRERVQQQAQPVGGVAKSLDLRGDTSVSFLERACWHVTILK